MPQSVEELTARLREATGIGARDNLVRRGLARGMIWRDGQVPANAVVFAESLTADLLDHGYGVLAQALRLRDAAGATTDVTHALRVAAESIESAVRRGARDEERDFHLVVASCAFHLAQFGARAYCLVPTLDGGPNLSAPEKALVSLMRRSLRGLREMCARWLRDEAHSDAALAARLEAGDADTLREVERVAITTNFMRAAAMFLTALERGDGELSRSASAAFASGAEAARECRHVPLWWVNTLARHLTDDLWANSIHVRVPPTIDGPAAGRWGQVRRRFISVLQGRRAAEIDLWPSQWEAADRCVDPTDDLVVALPTSAGKTRVAELCILRTLADGRRVVYVTPLRALSAQLERRLGDTFRPLGYTVTALYGASGVAQADMAGLRDGQIVVATPEKLDFALRVDASVLNDVGLVVLDEGHMIGLGTREIRYEVLVQRLLRRGDAVARRIVCLSAMFAPGDGEEGDDIVGTSIGVRTATPDGEGGARSTATSPAFADFTAWIRSDAPGRPIASPWRPTRQRLGTLTWERGGGRLELAVDGETPYMQGFVRPEPPRGRRRRIFPGDSAEFVLATAKAYLRDDQRVLIYCPQRRSVESLAELLLTVARQGHFPSVLKPDVDLTRALRVGREWLGAGHPALRVLHLGVGLHHGTLPRPFLSEIEELLHDRKLPLVIASPTLAQGVDLSCSALIFRSLYRNGDQTIDPEEFANVVGRAGRAYVDLDGVSVYPVFDDVRDRQRHLDAFHDLVRRSATRRLESGLVMLVEALIRFLAEGLGAPISDLRRYVLDVDARWDVEVFAVQRDGSQGPELIAPVLAELDTAILSSIEALDCAPEEVAAALDAALSSSLWARRLPYCDPEVAALAPDVVRGRAAWIWSRTTPAARRGYHAAGVGFVTGAYLDGHAEELTRLLGAAEAALDGGDAAGAGAAAVALAQVLRGVNPFAFEHAFNGWEAALRAWVAGDPVTPNELEQAVAEALERDGDDVVPFLQSDVVYRMVWGVEAARLHAVQLGVPSADLLTGSLASVLTYGTPSRAGVVLAQSGLSSREMIAEALRTCPGSFTSDAGLRDWLQEHGEQLDAPDFWGDAASREMWRSFRRRWTASGRSQWSDRRHDVTVAWQSGRPSLAAGDTVTLVPDASEGVIHVCDSALMPLGRVSSPLELDGQTVVAATVAADGAGVVVQTFGP